MQEVVGSIDRHEVGRRFLADDEPVHEQHEVDHATKHQVGAGLAAVRAIAKPAIPNNRCTMLCRIETWNSPNNLASEWWPANDRSPKLVVIPGMKPSTPTSRKTTPTMAAAFCTFVRVPRAVVVRSDMTVRLLGALCYRLFVAAAVWLPRCGRVWLLASPGQLLQYAGLDSDRALLLTGVGANANEGAGYRGHRPLQQLQLGLSTCHIGWSCGAWLGAGGHRNTGFLGHLAPKHPAVARDAQSGRSEGGLDHRHRGDARLCRQPFLVAQKLADRTHKGCSDGNGIDRRPGVPAGVGYPTRAAGV